MRKAICGLTGKEFDCLNCKAVKRKVCPVFKFDEDVNRLIKGIREFLTEAMNDKTSTTK